MCDDINSHYLLAKKQTHNMCLTTIGRTNETIICQDNCYKMLQYVQKHKSDVIFSCFSFI
jgi:hypothetical protein